MSHTRRIGASSALAVLVVLATMMVLPTLASPSMQGVNLVQNPNFELGLEEWSPWFYENIVMEAGKKNEANTELSFHAPDFLPSEPKWDHESGGKDESRA